MPLLTAVAQLAQPRSILKRKSSKTLFNIILPFPSKLCISDTYNFLPHVKFEPRFRSMLYYPAIRTGTAVSDVANVAIFQFREDVCRVRSEIFCFENSAMDSGWDAFLKYRHNNY